MTLFRRSRFWYWFAKELGQKYARFLLFGLFIGLSLTLALRQIYPSVIKYWFATVERIAIVGEFTPSTLPLSIQGEISSGLTQLADDGNPTPALATHWEATDSGKTFVFHLRDDYQWHSGKPVEAKDVNYNIKSVSFTAVNPQTLKVNLQSPYSPLPTLVGKPIFQAGLVGFGPYRVSAIRLKGDMVQYLKLIPLAKDNNKIRVYRFYRTENMALVAYKQGEVDMVLDISSPEQIARWGKTTVTETTKYDRIVSLFFNLEDPLLREKSFRQALAYGLPQLIGERAHSPISKNSWAYNEKVRHYDPDTTMFKKLLSNGKIDSETIKLTITTFSQYLEVAQDIANSWNNLGIKTEVKVENSISPNWQILLSAYDVPPDPDQYPFWHSIQIQTNITGYANVKIDKLLEDGRQEGDRERRLQIYLDFQKRLVEDAPVIFLYYPKTYTIRRGQ